MTEEIKDLGLPKARVGRIKGTTSRKMKPKEWAEAETLWESGNVTLKELSERFKMVEETFSRHFARIGIKKGSKAALASEKVREGVLKTMVDDATVLSTRIRETKEEHYKLSSLLVKLASNEILQAKRDGQPYESKLNNIKALDLAMNVIKKGREERWAVLGLDDPNSVNDDELPELMINEMTAAQIEDMQARQVQASQEFIDDINGVLDSTVAIEGEDDVVTEGE